MNLINLTKLFDLFSISKLSTSNFVPRPAKEKKKKKKKKEKKKRRRKGEKLLHPA